MGGNIIQFMSVKDPYQAVCGFEQAVVVRSLPALPSKPVFMGITNVSYD